MKGHFITFEGIEGSGKSTHMAALAEVLRQQGRDVLSTREPGGTRLGENIRNILLDARHTEMGVKTELLLYMASRAQHLHQVILPALEKESIVLCDRFSEATLAYQGYGRQLDIQMIQDLNHFVTDELKPDLILLLDVEIQRGLDRIQARGSRDRLEQEEMVFFERVRAGYLELAKMNPERMAIINANGDQEDTARQIKQALGQFLNIQV